MAQEPQELFAIAVKQIKARIPVDPIIVPVVIVDSVLADVSDCCVEPMIL